MNRGNVLQSSPVQQMLSGCPNSWWSIMVPSSRPCPPHPPLPPPPPPTRPPFLSTSSQPHCSFHRQYAQPSSSLSQWHDNNQDFPDSLTQLLMGGIDEKTALSYMQHLKKLENWEEQLLEGHCEHSNISSIMLDSSSVTQEHSVTHGKVEFYGVKPNTNNWSNQMIPVSSPTSCISTLSNNISTPISNKGDGRHPPPDHSSEGDSTATGGASKKAKIQPSSNNQTTFKVRKEKIGDRITALHQLVSPFGKTDTASVLLEAIGYIRFLHGQIEALSSPYLGSESVNLMRSHPHADFKDQPKKDLKSRALCLVPVSCTMQVGSDNGADYWAPALNGRFR